MTLYSAWENGVIQRLRKVEVEKEKTESGGVLPFDYVNV